MAKLKWVGTPIVKWQLIQHAVVQEHRYGIVARSKGSRMRYFTACRFEKRPPRIVPITWTAKAGLTVWAGWIKVHGRREEEGQETQTKTERVYRLTGFEVLEQIEVVSVECDREHFLKIYRLTIHDEIDCTRRVIEFTFTMPPYDDSVEPTWLDTPHVQSHTC